MNRRVLAGGAAVLLALALVAPACGGGEARPGEATLAIYVSAPLSGPARADGEDIADGARMALQEAGAEAAGFAVEATYLDVAGRNETAWDPVTAAANARRAREDSRTIAYIGELESGATRSSLPVTNAAGILQVAPGSGATDLVKDDVFNDEVPSEVQNTGDRTYAQLIPTYEPEDRVLAPARPDPEFAAAFRAEHGRAPGARAAYGYEAMTSVLAAIERADDPADRSSVIGAYLDGPVRESAIGAYRITDTGEFFPAGES